MSTLTAGMPGETFGARLARVVEERGRLCVGIDPHAALLASWGLPDSAAGVREFGLRVVEASAGTAGIVKPQIGFFERHGSAGFAALEDVLGEPVSRMTAYVEALSVRIESWSVMLSRM